MEETREELEEFQISSRELEQELEAQLEQLETKNKDNLSQINKLQTDNDGLRVRLMYICMFRSRIGGHCLRIFKLKIKTTYRTTI